MRALAIGACVIACGAWGFFAFVYAVYAYIEELSDGSAIIAGVVLAAGGIVCLLLTLRAGLGGDRARTIVMLALSLAALVAWAVVAIP